jgi:predicted acylesterase/phospholipase RssA
MLLGLNYLTKYNYISSTYQAFGLNYSGKLVDYNIDELKSITSNENYKSDSLATIEILNNWKNKFDQKKKPKMVFICTSGGGQRSASWTVNTLQTLDSVTNNQLSEHTQIISGASGGLIGASYYRELFLQQKQGKIKNATDRKYFNNITKDVLNPVIFSLVVNDIFLRYQTFSDGKYTYPKDRGYAFERHMNENLEQMLQKPISAYHEPEAKAQIPMLLISPTITNDGRKLFISPQNTSYMCTSTPDMKEATYQRIKGVEFMRFFKNQDAHNLNFMSALRMSATFPYIMPNVNLPSNPSMEIMDAGIADNFGITNAVKFMYVFKDWIAQNTDGVIFICIRDSEKELEIEKTPGTSILQKAFNPIGNIFNSWDYLQDINNDNFVDFAHSWFKKNVEMVEFKYLPQTNTDKNTAHVENASSKERASLSWHLTNKEKESIRNTIYQDDNLKSIAKLKKILH